MCDFIRIIEPGGSVGKRLSSDSYNSIKEFILKILHDEEALDISTLINLCYNKFEPQYGSQTGMLVYHVKRDLEARGTINHEYSSKKISLPKTSEVKAQERNSKFESGEKGYSGNTKVNKPVKDKFIELFQKPPLIVHAPGRINIIGEHTDYNNGLVMPAAINKGIQFAIAPASNPSSLIYSLKFNQFLSLNLKSIKIAKKTKWQNYITGVLFKLKQDGHKVRSFNCVFDGDLSIGSGLASSAALVCGFAMALNQLFDLKLTPTQLIEVAHWSENNFAKVKCGIMDQFVSVMGKPGNLIFLDCQSRKHTYFPIQLKDYCFMLCDSNVKHSHLTSVYNKRIDECSASVEIIRAKFPEINSLRDVNNSILEEVQEELGAKLFRRCKFVIEENTRVEMAIAHLLIDDLAKLGQLMYESHMGLSSLFEVSCDELDFLADFAKSCEGVLGARMIGGGFGGCTLNLIHNHNIGSFIEVVSAAYKTRFKKKLNCYVTHISNGTAVLENPFVKPLAKTERSQTKGKSRKILLS